MKKMLIALAAFGTVVAAAPASAETVTGTGAAIGEFTGKAATETAKQHRRWGRHHGGWRWRTVCRRVWRHGRPIRQCRRVRVRW